jgi:surfactin synthase thioesterase subunit
MQISAARDRWIRRFHPAPDAPVRLLCLPHAGGSAPFFHPVSAALAPRVEVLAVQYPGRQERRDEPCVQSIARLADRLLQVLADDLDRPLALFGHSMGASLAFELAGLLEQEAGFSPVVLFASGRQAPSRPDVESVHLRGDEELIAEMGRLGGTDARILADPEMRELVLPTLRGDFRAAETYRPERTEVLACPISALMGDLDPRAREPEVRAWQEHTTGEFDLRIFSGGHFYLAEHAAEVIRHIAGRLERPLPPLNRTSAAATPTPGRSRELF